MLTNNKPCIKHTYKLYNNRYYLNGKPVPVGANWGDDSTWVTEKICHCGKKFIEPKWIKQLI